MDLCRYPTGALFQYFQLVVTTLRILFGNVDLEGRSLLNYELLILLGS
jgi:hypothetical protein